MVSTPSYLAFVCLPALPVHRRILDEQSPVGPMTPKTINHLILIAALCDSADRN